MDLRPPGGGDHCGRFVDRRKFDLDEEPGLGRQESVAEKNTAGLGDGIQQRLRPGMFNDQEWSALVFPDSGS
ncbi:MAG: hypothetical protein ABIR68_19615 [Ilumatobacteraceae bacterium]